MRQLVFLSHIVTPEAFTLLVRLADQFGVEEVVRFCEELKKKNLLILGVIWSEDLEAHISLLAKPGKPMEELDDEQQQ